MMSNHFTFFGSSVPSSLANRPRTTVVWHAPAVQCVHGSSFAIPHRFWYSPPMCTRNASSAAPPQIRNVRLRPTPGTRRKYRPSAFTSEKSISYVSSPVHGVPSAVRASATRTNGPVSRSRTVSPDSASTSCHPFSSPWGFHAPSLGPSHAPMYPYFLPHGRYPTWFTLNSGLGDSASYPAGVSSCWRNSVWTTLASGGGGTHFRCRSFRSTRVQSESSGAFQSGSERPAGIGQ